HLLSLHLGALATDEELVDGFAGIVALQASHIAAFADPSIPELRDARSNLFRAQVSAAATQRVYRISGPPMRQISPLGIERARLAADLLRRELSKGWERIVAWHRHDQGDRDFSAPRSSIVEVIDRLTARDSTVELEDI